MRIETEPVPTNMRALLEKHNIIKKGLKYSNYEMLQALDLALTVQRDRLEKAKNVYREQAEKIERLSSPSLWRFSTKLEAPPDYRAEYMRRLKNGESLSFGVKATKLT
jgi:hypothetical protein